MLSLEQMLQKKSWGGFVFDYTLAKLGGKEIFFAIDSEFMLYCCERLDLYTQH